MKHNSAETSEYISLVRALDHAALKLTAAEGAHRVARVVDGSEDFDPIIRHKLSNELRDKIDRQPDLEAARQAAIDYTLKIITTSKPSIYIIPDVNILLFGRTRNNLREFDFILPLIDEPRVLSVANAADLSLVKRGHIPAALAQIASALTREIAEFYENRATISSGLVYQVGEFFAQFIRYVLSFSSPESGLPNIVVVANDHSPSSVGFSLAARVRRVPRLYVQHAEVTASFPPLDFEYSVLRNPLSKRIYEQIAPLTGEVFVISRFSAPSSRPPNLHSGMLDRPVIVYTTGRVEDAGLSEAVTALQQNPNVPSVAIKPHPSQEGAAWPEGWTIIGAHTDDPHVALVGNSSVAVELLHRGIPVFQNFSFDPVADDYYGFVEAGVTSPASSDELRGDFWTKVQFDDQWYLRFSDAFAPSEDLSRAERRRFAEAMSLLHEVRRRPASQQKVLPSISVKQPILMRGKLVDGARRYLPDPVFRLLRSSYRHFSAGRRWDLLSRGGRLASAPARSPQTTIRRVSEAKAEWARFSLLTSKKPAERLRQSWELNILLEEEIIKAIERLYADRQPIVFDIFDQVEVVERSTYIAIWLSLRRFDIAGVPPPQPLGELVASILRYDGSKYVRASLEGLAFAACLRANDRNALNKLLANGKHAGVEKLSTTRRIALLKYFAQAGNLPEYTRLREIFMSAESPLHRLKIADIDAQLYPRNSKPHQSMEDEFSRSVGGEIANEFRTLIKPAYEHVRPAMRFMDVRSSVEEREMFLNLVVDALDRRRPLSMIRLGDGEAYALSERHEFFTEEDRRNRERHWWGLELDAAHREEISNHVRAAIDGADILGIPSIYRFIRDTLDKSTSYKSNIQGRGLLQVLSQIARTDRNAVFGEDRMNLALFRSSESMRRLLNACEKCVLVTSAVAVPTWMNEITNVVRVEIPTHLRTSRNESYNFASEPLPLVYDVLDQQVREETSPGTLVLVAGGIVGKIFIGSAKSAGGVALDLGSVMDEWAGTGIHSLN